MFFLINLIKTFNHIVYLSIEKIVKMKFFLWSMILNIYQIYKADI